MFVLSNVSKAIRETISTSLIKSSEEGVSLPIEVWTIPIEFSTVTNCSTPFLLSISVLPRQGRIRASFPVTKWERLSLVDTCIVNPTFCIACAVKFVSGVADRKLPPMQKNVSTLPSCIARIALTTSYPCLKGNSSPNPSDIFSINASGAASQIPTVLSP